MITPLVLSPALSRANELRAARELEPLSSLFEHYTKNAIISFTGLGFEYARVKSPMLHHVGASSSALQCAEGPRALTSPLRSIPPSAKEEEEWLDEMEQQGKSVAVVSFGTRARLAESTVVAIASGILNGM